MKNYRTKLVFLLLMFVSSYTYADETIESAVIKACKTEIDTFCSQVTLGEGRLLACFYAHEDKLSAECGFTLYKAAKTLEEIVVAFNYVANACEVDIKTLCANVKPGEGRIVGCLNKNSTTISSGCNKALKKVGAK